MSGGAGLRARAADLQRLQRDVDALAEVRHRSAAEHGQWLEAAARWNDQVRAFYLPLEQAHAGLRRGDVQAVEPALEFLEADPWCFRSGYMKADLMHALANFPDLDAASCTRLQEVVLLRLTHPQPRLLRHAVRLATAVWDDRLRARVTQLARGDGVAAANARHVLSEVRR